MRSACLLLLFTIAFLLGCGGGAEPDSGDPPVPVAAEAREAKSDGAAGGEVTVVGMTFKLPEGWREVELTDAQRSFVDARFEVPTSGEPLNLTVTSAGGGVEANIDRWKQQMELEPGDSPLVEEFDAGAVTARWVDIRGTYRAGMTGGGGGPNTNYRLLGVAIPHSPRDIYLKLTGPQDLVAEVSDEVRQFAESARPR